MADHHKMHHKAKAAHHKKMAQHHKTMGDQHHHMAAQHEKMSMHHEEMSSKGAGNVVGGMNSGPNEESDTPGTMHGFQHVSSGRLPSN